MEVDAGWKLWTVFRITDLVDAAREMSVGVGSLLEIHASLSLILSSKAGEVIASYGRWLREDG